MLPYASLTRPQPNKHLPAPSPQMWDPPFCLLIYSRNIACVLCGSALGAGDTAEDKTGTEVSLLELML